MLYTFSERRGRDQKKRWKENERMRTFRHDGSLRNNLIKPSHWNQFTITTRGSIPTKIYSWEKVKSIHQFLDWLFPTWAKPQFLTSVYTTGNLLEKLTASAKTVWHLYKQTIRRDLHDFWSSSSLNKKLRLEKSGIICTQPQSRRGVVAALSESVLGGNIHLEGWKEFNLTQLGPPCVAHMTDFNGTGRPYFISWLMPSSFSRHGCSSAISAKLCS